METETKTVRIADSFTDDEVELSLTDLQTVVQKAYEQFGITADPFAAPGSADVPDEGKAATHAMAMAHNAGVRA